MEEAEEAERRSQASTDVVVPVCSPFAPTAREAPVAAAVGEDALDLQVPVDAVAEGASRSRVSPLRFVWSLHGCRPAAEGAEVEAAVADRAGWAQLEPRPVTLDVSAQATGDGAVTEEAPGHQATVLAARVALHSELSIPESFRSRPP